MKSSNEPLLASLEDQVKMARKLKCALANASRNRAEADKYRLVILWALGEVESFPMREENQGSYWWRTELRKRAGMDKP